MAIQRVLIAINVRWWNAEAAYALNLAKGLTERGIKVWLLANPGSPVHQKAGTLGMEVIEDVLLDSASPIQQWRNFKILKTHITENQIQLINSFKSNGAFLFSLIRRFNSNVTYIKTRGVAVPPKRNFVNRYVYCTKSCDGIITTGSLVHGWMRTLLGEKTNQQLRTIYYGDSPIGEGELSETSNQRRELGIPQESLLFCLLGRTQKVKGHQLLLDALVLLSDLDIHLLFLVKDPDEFPQELTSMKKFIKDHNLQERVTILGHQKNLHSVLSVVDFGVIPSLDSEVNCRVCVEFFSMGIPVISFPTGTLPDIIHHRKNGYLCRDKTVGELVEGIRWMSKLQQGSSNLRDQALSDYRKSYTLQAMTDLTLDFYKLCRSLKESR